MIMTISVKQMMEAANAVVPRVTPAQAREMMAKGNTLVVDVRDSTTGAPLGRVVDRRETRTSAGMQLATSVSNLADFRILFKQWAGITVDGLAELKAHSPVPLDLKPKQTL
jgi:hypothetical protein